MNTLDKYIIKTFAVNYAISLAALMSIYVILDLFFNFDEFVQEDLHSAWTVLAAVARYYGAHLFLYFSQISGVITLFAMAFTLARLQRNNEFVAIVSSGVSLYRVALTVIVTCLALNSLWLINQELVIPQLAPRLAQTHEAAASNRPYGVWFLKDHNGALLSASRFDHHAGQLSRLVLLQRGSSDQPEVCITADRATWKPRTDGKGGIWQLDRGSRRKYLVDEDGATESIREPIASFKSELSPDAIALRQSRNWIQFLSRRQLARIGLQNLASAQLVARAMHNRFATPIVNMLILIIGIPFFLDRQPGSVVHSSGKCLLVCGACFLFAFVSQTMTADRFPALTAWLPLIALTPVMVVSLDRMRT